MKRGHVFRLARWSASAPQTPPQGRLPRPPSRMSAPTSPANRPTRPPDRRGHPTARGSPPSSASRNPAANTRRKLERGAGRAVAAAAVRPSLRGAPILPSAAPGQGWTRSSTQPRDAAQERRPTNWSPVLLETESTARCDPNFHRHKSQICVDFYNHYHENTPIPPRSRYIISLLESCQVPWALCT